jgi:hypothetical protein
MAARAQSATEVAQLLVSADEAWTAGKYDDALDRYSRVLRADSTSARALFRTATVLSWRNELDRAIALLRLYLRVSPGDVDGSIALARTLAWSGRYRESLALSDSLLASNPGQRDAALLGAQALAWSGQLEDAIARYQSWLATHGDDTEAWVALAQTWRWAGRPEQARRAVEHALAIDPRNVSARSQFEWATASLAPSLEPTITNTNDSDDNRSTLYVMRGGLATPWGARVAGDGSLRIADLGLRHGSAATLRASSSWSPVDGRFTLRGELGGVRLDASESPGSADISHFEPIVAGGVSARPIPALSLGAGVSHAAFDETASLILAGIASTTIDGDADVKLRPRLSLGAGGGWTHLSGGSGPNSRVVGSGALRWSFSPFISIAAGARGFAYQHSAFDGYFAPKRYLLSELSSRLRLGGDLGWGVEGELGLGNQSITAFDNSKAARFAQRINAAIVYRPAAGMEWAVRGGFANVASPATVSSADYRAYSVSFTARWRL